MHNRWQLLVVVALALSAFNFHNNSAAEQPATTTTTTTTSQPPTATAPTTTTTTTNPPGEQDQSGEGRQGQPGPEQGPADQVSSHRVVLGDNLWTIARDQLASARGGAGEPTNREVAAYWRRVVETNRDRLVSGDPDLIYPGEEIVLPPVD